MAKATNPVFNKLTFVAPSTLGGQVNARFLLAPAYRDYCPQVEIQTSDTVSTRWNMVAVRATPAGGMDFLTIAEHALHIADTAKCPVEFNYNGYPIVAPRRGTLEDIDRQMDAHRPTWRDETAYRRNPAQPA